MNKIETNILKGIAIIMMYIHHLFYLADRLNYYDVQPMVISKELLVKIGGYGNICVALFAFLSGYGLTKTYIKGSNSAKGILRRILRLQLSVVICLLLGLLVATLIGEHTYADVYLEDGIVNSIYYFICDALGISYLLGTPSYNGAWWYLSIAIWIISFIPIVCWFIEKMGKKIVIFLILLYYVFSRHCAHDNLLYNLYIYGLFIPLIGVVMAMHNRFLLTVRNKKWIGLIFGILGILAGYNCSVYFAKNVEINKLLSVIGFLFLSLLLSRISLLAKILETLGNNSKYMFLCHSFFLSYFFKDHIYWFKIPILILLVLIVETLVVSLFMMAIEKKIISFIREKKLLGEE